MKLTAKRAAAYLWPALPAAVAAAIFLLLPSTPRAADLRYDPAAAARKETMVRLYVDTRLCMVNGSLAMLRLGARKQADVESFTVAACGSQLRIELTGYGSFTPADAEQMLRELAAASLIEALTR